MKFLFAIALVALVGCASNSSTKIKQCNRILNAPDFVRASLKDLNPYTAEIHNNDTITNEVCKPFETITCEGVEYRLYDVCLPSRSLTCTIATEEDFR